MVGWAVAAMEEAGLAEAVKAVTGSAAVVTEAEAMAVAGLAVAVKADVG